MSGAILEVQGLTFSYAKDKPVLENADLHVHSDEKVGLWSPNGSGKTTFLRLLTGLLPAEKGSITFDGAECRTKKDFHEQHLKLGYVLQNSEDQLFFPEVLEDVAFGPLNQGLDEKEAVARAREALAQVGMSGKENALYSELSGGQKKLVAIASVLAMKPKMLLLDEPTAGIDQKGCERITGLLRGLDIPIVLVSHDPKLLTDVCSSFYEIEDRQFKKLGAPTLHVHEHVHFFGSESHHHSLHP
jgi:cobalt/nickel transport system ATP-binding protein